MSPFLINLTAARWDRTLAPASEFFLQGCVYKNDKKINAPEFLMDIRSSLDHDRLPALLKQLNGFYSWINWSESCICAGVDHIRSFPLFYAQKGNYFYLSDDAEWVRLQINDCEMDALARDEFLLAGYVTGSDTLYPNVKQLQAGEFVQVNWLEGVIQLRLGRYYRFLHVEPKKYDEDHLKNQLDNATRNSMLRLIEYADGRQIAVPLSGGYDSRLIAAMLKNLGYDNVLCFTYGVPGNKEAEYSRQVAKALNFKWVFVEYSADLWRKEWSTPEARAYRQMAANHVSLPHVQDWLAIKQLIANGTLHSNAVIAPGHSGDFVAGSHIPSFAFSEKKHSEDDLLKTLIDDHLSNAPLEMMDVARNELLKNRLKDRIGIAFDGAGYELANLYEMWDWQERQAKYIVNSVRVYDQFELNWWLPQWDLEFVRFWAHVPLVLRKQRAWFKEWISEKYAREIRGIPDANKLNSASDTPLVRRVLFKVVAVMPRRLLEVLKKARRKRVYKNHFLAFEGLIDVESFPEYIKKGYNIIGMYCDSYIRGKW